LLNALKGGSSADIIVDEMRERLELRQKELAEHIETADQPIPLIHPKMADLYHERLQELYLSLKEPETRIQAMEIIRSLIDYIELVPVGGELKARTHGDIAGLFNFMSHEKTPTASADGFLIARVYALTPPDHILSLTDRPQMKFIQPSLWIMTRNGIKRRKMKQETSNPP